MGCPACSGIGASLAAEFHAKGCMVYASARRMEAMQSLPAGVHKLLLDVTNEASIKAAVAKVCGGHRGSALQGGWGIRGSGVCLAGVQMAVDAKGGPWQV